MKHRPTTFLWLLLGLTVSLTGCGKGPRVFRLPVFGAVSLSSGEKPNGSITFLPDEGRSGPAATASLVDGEYRFDHDNGPTAGPHRVMVTRIVPKETTLASRGDKKQPLAVPAETRTKWTVLVDLAPNGPYRRDFTLEP